MMDNKLFEDIYNEVGPIKNLYNGIKARSQVNKQIKNTAQNQANKAAKQNVNNAQEILKTLQAVANEQNNFDENTIQTLLQQINTLNISDDFKKQINHILNNQKAALSNPADTQPQQQSQQQQDANANATINNSNNAKIEKLKKDKVGEHTKYEYIKSWLKGLSKDDAIALINQIYGN